MSILLAPFDYQPRTRLIFGAGALARLGEIAREVGATRVLLVTDPGIVKAGHAAAALAALNAAGLTVVTYDRSRENPTTQDVAACLAVAQAAHIDGLVGLGGGSSLDTAKGCNFLYTNGGRMQDYWGIGKASKPMLPLIAVPTTAGTGSECQSFALIADETTHQKMACGDPKAAARVAILDPMLTLTLPRAVTACTGIDTVAHAVETAVTTRRNSISQLFSQESFKLAAGALPLVLQEPGNLEVRSRMLLAAAYGGTAIENSMLGCAHSMANPLTARFGLVHGQAVGMMLPYSVEFNARDKAAKAGYEQLAAYAGLVDSGSAAQGGVAALIETLVGLLKSAEFPASLAACGVTAAAIPALAKEAAQQWTAQFNPRPVEERDFAQMYAAALEGRGIDGGRRHD